MRNKIFFILSLCFTGSLLGQTNAASPYSSQGLGETSFFGSSYFQSLGGASASLIDSTQTNFFNPSSYASISEGLPLFSLGIDFRNSTLSENGNTGSLRYSNLTHFSLVVPFKKRFGLGFGLRPYSRVGYEVNDSEVIDNDSLFYEYAGKGGIQQAFFGLSSNIVDKKKHKFAIGVNAGFLFGFTYNSSRAFSKISGASATLKKGSILENQYNYKGFNYEFGTHYTFKPNKSHQLTIGATYTLEQSINAELSSNSIFYTNENNINTYDTLNTISGETGLAYLPTKLNVGFTYVFSPKKDAESNRKLEPQFMLTAEYGMENWSAFKREIGPVLLNDNLKDISSLRFGLEIVPHKNPLDRSTIANYFAKINYRVGVYSTDLPMMANGQQLSELGTSFGIGLPIVFNRALSTVNIGVSYGQRGNDNINTIQENFWGINFGVNLSPGYDRWFRKYKYD